MNETFTQGLLHHLLLEAARNDPDFASLLQDVTSALNPEEAVSPTSIRIYALYDRRDSEQEPRYVGSTTQALYQRRSQHCTKPTNTGVGCWIIEIGRDNVGIRELAECDTYERDVTEAKHISEWPNVLNVRSV